ncbi:MAG: hypothetical protein HQK77_04720 [Desulfobacterales bacterium]|nr:hypothetical protein [Desulfobacterales bacterium]
MDNQKIQVIGVGKCGLKAVNYMIDQNITGLNFIAADTEKDELQRSKAPTKIQLGTQFNKNEFGTGSKPDIGRTAALENVDDIRAVLEGSRLVFIIAGFGGGTGTGASPVIAEICKQRDILSIALISKPIALEGRRMYRNSNYGIEALRNIETVFIPTQILYKILSPISNLSHFFSVVDFVFLMTIHKLMHRLGDELTQMKISKVVTEINNESEDQNLIEIIRNIRLAQFPIRIDSKRMGAMFMFRDYHISIIDNKLKNSDLSDHFILGHCFLFCQNDPKTNGASETENSQQIQQEPKRKIFPFLDKPIQVAGIQIERKATLFRHLCCVVTDRELYQSGQDTVNVFIACPNPPTDIQLYIKKNKNSITQRKVKLQNGIGIERFMNLPPGQYTATLALNRQFIETPAAFTIAEYCLTELSAHLVYYKLDRTDNMLDFELMVESFQMPFNEPLKVNIVTSTINWKNEGIILQPNSPGRFLGRIDIPEEIEFELGIYPIYLLHDTIQKNIKLRLQSVNDKKKIAEVNVSVSSINENEREYTTISELGDEILFSMLPEPNSIPTKSGYLTKRDYFESAVTIDNILSDNRTIQINQNVNELTLIYYDILSVRYTVQYFGDVVAGTVIPLHDTPPIMMVFAACFINDKTFEGYATFLKRDSLKMNLKVPEKINYGEDLSIKINVDHTSDSVPVLVSVRDARLTSLNQPDIKLGADLKQIIKERTQRMINRQFIDIKFYIENCMGTVRHHFHDYHSDFLTFNKTNNHVPKKKPFFKYNTKTDTDFFNVYYFEIIHVQCGVEKELIIPLQDNVGNLIVDTFALHQAEWLRCESRVIFLCA